MDCLVEKLRLRVMRTRARFSDQELEELKEEMYRTQLAVDLKILHMQLDIRRKKLNVIDSVQIGQVQRVLDYEKVIGKGIYKEGQEDREQQCYSTKATQNRILKKLFMRNS